VIDTCCKDDNGSGGGDVATTTLFLQSSSSSNSNDNDNDNDNGIILCDQALHYYATNMMMQYITDYRQIFYGNLGRQSKTAKFNNFGEVKVVLFYLKNINFR